MGTIPVSATAYLITHGEEMGIDPQNIVVSGSSAGAITALSTEIAICNREPVAQILPPDFNYRELISFAGAIITQEGMPKYKQAPCPHLFFIGTKDEYIPYNRRGIGKSAMIGPNYLAKQFSKRGYQYHIYRLENYDHKVANMMDTLWEAQEVFLERVVQNDEKWFLDTTIRLP